MPWTNYHSHTNFSDGSDPPSEYIEEAIRQGMHTYGFSCHAPVPFKNSWSMQAENMQQYFLEINRLKDAYSSTIKIHASLEIDYIPGITGPADPLFTKYPLDYKIGSVHFVGCFEDGYPWGIDGSEALFEEGMQKIWRGDARKAVQTYFQILSEMISTAKPDIIAHFDKIRMHNEGNLYFSEEDNWYRLEVLDSLELIRSSKCLLEVNTRGMYRGNKKEPYPSLWILKEAAKMKIPIVMNSDAHKPHESTGHFTETSALLIECGYRKLHNLISGSWEPISFNSNGIFL